MRGIIVLAMVSVMSTRTIQLAWNAVAGATLYKVEKNNGGSFTEIGTSSVNSITISGLPEEDFEVRVSAYNGLWGQPSALINVPASAPSQVTGVTVVSTTPDA